MHIPAMKSEQPDKSMAFWQSPKKSIIKPEMYGPIIWPMLKVVVKKATANFIEPACLIFPSINTKPTMPTTPIPNAMQANNEAPIPSKKYKVSIPVEQVKQDKAKEI